MALTNSAWPLLLIWGLELFPTEIRASACGVLYASGKAGAIVGTIIFAAFLHANCLIPILCVAVACFICGCLALLLHDTSTHDID